MIIPPIQTKIHFPQYQILHSFQMNIPQTKSNIAQMCNPKEAHTNNKKNKKNKKKKRKKIKPSQNDKKQTQQKKQDCLTKYY